VRPVVYERRIVMVETKVDGPASSWSVGRAAAAPAEDGGQGRFGCDGVWLRYSIELPFVLRDVTLDLQERQLLGVVGHNGAGKSSLLKVLAGVVRPSRGHVHIDGRKVDGVGARTMVERGVACVYQELSTVPTMSVRENLLLGFVKRGPLVRSPKAARARVEELVERCGLDDLDLDERVERLGFGDRQRVEIARAVASNARFLLLDEPTAGLRGQSRSRLFSLLRSLQDEGIGLLMVNHHIDEVLELCQRILVLRDGVVVADVEAASVSEEQVASLMVGHDLDGDRTSEDDSALATSSSMLLRADAKKPTDDSTLSLQEQARLSVLRCSSLQSDALRGVDLELVGGKVHGFYGLEGAGQDELLRVLVGSTPRRAGRIELDGRELRLKNPRAALRRGVVYISGDRAEMVVGSMTGTDNVFVGAIGQRRLLGWVPGPTQRERVARPLMDEFRVRGDWLGPVLSLSGGNQQKVVVSRALLLHPKVLLLDEPTLGVDIEARAQILAMVRHLAEAEGAIVCLASTDEQEILDCCDDVTIFSNGRVVASFAAGDGVTKIELRNAAMGSSR
jgi:ABC-type sugar transport system ATPase subunit